MSIADKSLTIDVWGSITSLSLIQGESNGRKLIYTITDKGEPLDLTGKSVRLFVVKPDGAIVYTDCEIETAAEGKVSFVVSSQMVVTAGLGSGELHIRNAEDDLLKTPKISILVEPSHNVDEAVESSNEFDVLTELINSIDFRTLSRVFSAGRPDKPETTVFTAEELDEMPIGTEFVSTDGANVGAWVWTKFGRAIVFRDIPSPPYKQGDLWHMPELTVDYWLNCGLTVDQVMALSFTVEERMGGHSYVCINSRSSGSFNRSDWEITGTTDKTTAKLEQRIVTNTNEITALGMTVTQVTEDVQQVASDLEEIELTPGPSAYEVAVAAGFEGTEAEWLASLVGETGATGAQGVPGADGIDGVTTYTWIRYADNASGSGISNDPTNKTYIGLAHNKTSATESNNPADYTWSLIKGDKGDQGIPGATGADGQTTY
ncbi:MAG TPA: BppU family phage baseplate upper protein, partial [Bacteroidales bacterium]|nr:BppU family phage baseplate upper protein [Bacteroidales bacterium]